MRGYHVLVEWPDAAEPWLIFVVADDEASARKIVEESDDVRSGHGVVVSVTEEGEKVRS